MTPMLCRAAIGATFLFAPPLLADGFDIVVLGATGGIQSGNLSAFMIHPSDDPRAVTCDAGSIVNGLIEAEAQGSLDHLSVPDASDYTRVGHAYTEVIKGYAINHAHLDHVAGLIIGSPDDGPKKIYSLPSVLRDIQTTYFNWTAWPNFGTTGTAPQLGKYDYVPLVPGRSVEVVDTGMRVTAHPLAHGPVEAAAFVYESGDAALLCFGDTGPDSVEGGERMADIWRAVADRAASGTLKAVIIESSYTSDRPDDLLFGHLTPRYVLEGLDMLARLAGGQGSLAGLPVIISHVKYSLLKGPSPQERILAELEAGNTQGVRFIMPVQGARYELGDWK